MVVKIYVLRFNRNLMYAQNLYNDVSKVCIYNDKSRNQLYSRFERSSILPSVRLTDVRPTKSWCFDKILLNNNSFKHYTKNDLRVFDSV